jgi:GR25 family glycosyltransferase involved in LPS biosynthesis
MFDFMLHQRVEFDFRTVSPMASEARALQDQSATSLQNDEEVASANIIDAYDRRLAEQEVHLINEIREAKARLSSAQGNLAGLELMLREVQADRRRQQGLALPAPPSSSSLEATTSPILVISLNNEEGQKRKAQLNYEHTIFEAYDHLSNEPNNYLKMTGRGQETTGTAPRQRAAFFSHYKCWQKVAEGNINTIIAEDDAILVRNRRFDSTTFPDDSITLLGGCVRTPGAWAREKAEFIENITEQSNVLKVVMSFKEGLNDIDYKKKCRWTNCLAYYLPVSVAKILVEKVQAKQDSEGKFQVKAVDIWLGESGCVKQLFYPNPFMDMLDSVTQVNAPKGHQKADHYINEMMRKALLNKNIHLNVRGASTLLRLEPDPEASSSESSS